GRGRWQRLQPRADPGGDAGTVPPRERQPLRPLLLAGNRRRPDGRRPPRPGGAGATDDRPGGVGPRFSSGARARFVASFKARFSLGLAERPLGCKEVVVRPVRFVVVALAMVVAASQTLTSSAGTTPTNTRVTKDNIAGSYVSADVLGGTGTYS